MARTVFTNANVLDGEHAAKPDHTVVVEDGKITQVTPGTVETGPEDRVVDCTGRTVMPGMTQGHYHSTYHNVGSPLAIPLGLESPPAYQAYVAQHNIGLALECGITSVVGANEAWDIDPSLNQAVMDGLVKGPRVIAGCREIITTADSNDLTPWWWESTGFAGTRMADGPDEFRKAVRDEIRRGAEVIKLFVTGGHGVRLSRNTISITREELFAATEAAHNLDKRVRCHVASREGVMMCLDAGVDIIDHGDGIDDVCIERMADAGCSYEPSVYSHKVVADLMGDTEYADPEWGGIMRATCAAIPKCVEAGVNIVLGDDYGAEIIPHGSYGAEPGFYVDFAGVTPLEVIKWATVNGGKLVGMDDLGRLEPGFRADVVVLAGDPSEDIHLLEDTGNILGVMRDGLLLVDKLGSGDRQLSPA